VTSSEPVLSGRRLLVVDDDADTLGNLAGAGRPAYRVLQALPGPAALAQLELEWPDLVVLEPSCRGAEELALAIKRRADIPIIAVSRDRSASAKVRALCSYAEDYVTKPFDVGELNARIDRVLHRMHGRLPAKDLRLSPDVTLMLSRRVALVRGHAVNLSPTDTRLLAVLAAELGQPVPTGAIAAHAGDPGSPRHADPEMVWVWVCRARRKIERDPAKPELLLTVRGNGYRLTPRLVTCDTNSRWAVRSGRDGYHLRRTRTT
jgi:DNA-binding response OmpR family regulator